MSAVKFFGGPSAAAATVADPGPWGEGPGLRPMLGDAVSAARAAPWRVAPLGGGHFCSLRAYESREPAMENGRQWQRLDPGDKLGRAIGRGR